VLVFYQPNLDSYLNKDLKLNLQPQKMSEMRKLAVTNNDSCVLPLVFLHPHIFVLNNPNIKLIQFFQFLMPSPPLSYLVLIIRLYFQRYSFFYQRHLSAILSYLPISEKDLKSRQN